MPTPSDPTAVPERSYDEMAQAAQAAVDEATRAVDEHKASFERWQQSVNPNQKMPFVSGDCILGDGDEKY